VAVVRSDSESNLRCRGGEKVVAEAGNGGGQPVAPGVEVRVGKGVGGDSSTTAVGVGQQRSAVGGGAARRLLDRGRPTGKAGGGRCLVARGGGLASVRWWTTTVGSRRKTKIRGVARSLYHTFS
jgi:hypothetical protein